MPENTTPSSQVTVPPEKAPIPSLSLGALLGETLGLLGQNFVVVYPIFLYFILRSLVLPRTMPDFTHWAWWAVSLGMVAIWFLFEAGWHTMMYQAVRQWETTRHPPATSATETEAPPSFMSPFALLKYFIPGIGAQGPAFLLAGLLYALPTAGVLWLGYRLIGIPQFLQEMLHGKLTTPEQLEQAMRHVSVYEQWQAIHWDLLLVGLFGVTLVIKFLTLYWQAFFLIEQCSLPRAFWLSLRCVFRHPMMTVALVLLALVVSLMSGLLLVVTEATSFLGVFLLILSLAFFGLLLYLYVYRLHQREHTPQP